MKPKRRMRNSGRILKEGRGWALRWVEGGRRRYRSGFATEDDAKKVLAHVLAQVALGKAGIPEPRVEDTRTLGDLAPEWLGRRDHTHKAAKDDRRRWKLHLGPFFGRMKPNEVGTADVERFITQSRSKLAPGTIGVCVHILSALFSDLMSHKPTPFATSNPCHALPKEVRRLMKGKLDPENVSFIEKLSDVKRIYLTLPEPVSIAYALGAMAGLRTGEIVALKWEQVDLASRTITVRFQADRNSGEEREPKSGKPRKVPILDGLLPVLTEWKLKSGGKGLVVRPMQAQAAHISRDVLWDSLAEALASLGLQAMTWYQATRHTFGSQWVMADRSMEKLSMILGHSSISITEKYYVHLRRDLFSERDLSTLDVDLGPSTATVAPIRQTSGRADQATITNA